MKTSQNYKKKKGKEKLKKKKEWKVGRRKKAHTKWKLKPKGERGSMAMHCKVEKKIEFLKRTQITWICRNNNNFWV